MLPPVARPPLIATDRPRWKPDRLTDPVRTYQLGGSAGQLTVGGWAVGRGSSNTGSKHRWTEVYVYRIAGAPPSWAVETVGRTLNDDEDDLYRVELADTPADVITGATYDEGHGPHLSATAVTALRSAASRDPALSELLHVEPY